MRIQSRNVWIAGQFLPGAIVVENGRILSVEPHGTGPADQDFGDARLVPGFLDLHTHGAYGYDTCDADPDGLRRWLAAAPREGVTGLLPTTITESEAVLTRAVQSVDTVAQTAPHGAEILGIHLEGPHLSLRYKGAQPPAHITPPSVALFERLQAAAGGRVTLVTLAPEEDPGHVLTRHCAGAGVAVNMGHTAATWEQALFACANGVTGATHTFNAMPPFSHRAPGAVGAVLGSRDLYGEIIPDGVHVDLAAVRHFFAAKGDRAVAVTDSLNLKGGERHSYTFGGHEITLRGDGAAAVLAGTDTLAGSILAMNHALSILAERALVPFGDALDAMTQNPARRLGLDRKKGRIAAGCDADIVVLAGDYSVVQTFCRGRACIG